MEMDDEDIFGVKDKANTVWQWRILHAKKYSTHPDPFFHSNKIGLNFNVASSSRPKLNSPFVPNGVILEVCEFARTIIKSRMHFIPNILENNFDLEFDNDQQRIDFTTKIQHKLEDLVQKPATNENEVFSLFDTWKTECSNNGLNKATRTHKPQSFFMQIENISELEQLLKCSSEKETEDMSGSHTDGDDQKDNTDCSGREMKEVVSEYIPLMLFPFCENIGLNLGTGTKQSLDPGLLTESVMFELLDFARVLTASFTSIVVSVLEHNFELDLKSHQRRNEVWLLISQMLKRGKEIASSNTNFMPEFENEPFFFERNPLKRAYVPALSTVETLLSEETKRLKPDFSTSHEKMPPSVTKCIMKKDQGQLDENVNGKSLSHNTELCSGTEEEDEHCHMCPMVEDADSESSGLQNSTGCDMSTESLSRLSKQSHATTDGSCNSSTLNKDLTPPSDFQPKKTLQGNGETQIPRNVPNDFGIDQEREMDSNLWKLRASRVNHILLTLDKDQSRFISVRNLGVEFDVGFGPKQHLSLDDLTSPVLFELAQFALAMNSSQQEFIQEILENNFDLCLQSERHQKTFMCEVMKRVRELQKCEDAVKFSKEGFELPVSVSPVDSVYQSSVIAEPSPMSNIGFCEGRPVCGPNSHTEARVDLPSEPESVSEDNMDLYPFCKDIGLRLQAKCRHSTGKVAINKLTKGAMTEVVNFATTLCGTFEEICMDVLRHNFDLQSMDSYLATTIFAQIAAVNEQKNLSDNVSCRIMKHSIADPSILMYGRKPSDTEAQNNPSLLLWLLRENRVKQILSVPHGDQCPLYSYSICKNLGLDFNVGSGVKRNLDPKCLTNGIMVELATFAKTLQLSEKDFLTEILEFNFDLNFNNELHRNAFTKQLSADVFQLISRNKKFPLKSKQQFELPDLRCLEECNPDCPKCYRDRIETCLQDESESDHMPHVRPHNITDESRAHICTQPKFAKIPVSNFSSAEILTKPYRHSKEAGLSLCVDRDRPKEKLDLHVLTEEVMLDVIHFAQKLCGAETEIIHDVLEHNFNLTQNHIKDLTRHFCDRMRTNIEELAWFNEVVDLDKSPSKAHQNESDGCFEKVSSCEGASHFMATDDLPSSPVNTDVSSPSSDVPEEVMMQDSETEDETLRNVPNKSDMNHEEMETETNMWKFRSIYVQKILLALSTEFYPHWSLGFLEFDVASGPPRNFNSERLTTFHLHKVVHFALALSSSQQNVLVDILEYNFNLGLQSEYQKITFAREVMKRVQELLARDDRDNILKDVFVLPGSLSFSNVKCESDDSVDSEPETSQTASHLYPFCKKIGLKLNVSFCHPDKKLELHKLTNGAVIEIVNFAEKLCGSYEQICVDVLRHNFDLDSQISDSDLAQNILSQVPFAIEETNLRYFCKKTQLATTINVNVMDSQRNTSSQACTMSSVKAEMNQSASQPGDVEAQNDPELLLWKLRANQVQQILSVPHKDQCPLYSYSRCKTLGIDFDVGSGLKRRLDPKLLTNGIMCELFTFATELGSSMKHFMTEILEYNFNLHFNNTFHRSAFTNTLMEEVKSMNRKRSTVTQLKSLFDLPDERLIQEVAPFYTNCPVNLSHTMMNVVSADANHEKNAANAPMSTFPATEVITKQYHFSKKAGLSLCVDKAHPKVKLDKRALTCRVMHDVYSFSKKLCGAKFQTVNDILEHNFDLDKKIHVENIVQHFFSRLKYKGDPAWFHEVFDIKQSPKEKVKLKDPPPVLSRERRELFQKRKRDMQKVTDISSELQNNNVGKHLAKCQPNECQSEGDEDKHVPTNLPNGCIIDHNLDPEVKIWKLRANRVRQILPFVKLMSHQTFNGLGASPCFPDASTQLNLRKVPSATPSENLLTSDSLQSAITKHGDTENMQDCGPPVSEFETPALEFDVGFQPKRNLSPDYLTNYALFCIALFALEMNASQEEFMMEILKNSFDLRLKSRDSEKSFAHEVIKQVRELANCGEAAKDLKQVFRLPGSLSFSNLIRQTRSSLKSEPRPTSSTEECDVSLMGAPTLSAENELSTATETSQNNVDLYPFCNDIGLKLTVCGCQPNQKLDVNKLTKGAMIEVLTFAEKLCGSYEQICVDVLRHNFDLDLQDADSDLARKILEQVPLVIAQRNLQHNFKRVRSRRKFNPIDINCQNSPSSESCSTGPIKANIDHSMSTYCDIKVRYDPDLLLWRLRANRIQEILSVPHGEQCPFYPYRRCVKSGIDFNVGSGLKRNLDPKLLTNGIMNEICTFSEALLSSAKHFMTEIWEYNFHLNFKGELHRSAFTYQIVLGKNYPRQIQETLFKLPDPTCMKEKAPFCRKCYQDRQDDPGEVTCSHPHITTDQATADANYSEQNPYEFPIAFFPAAEILTRQYRSCKAIGLSLCVDRNYPRGKLDQHVLTNAVQKEIDMFARKLCGTRLKNISDILEHNFKLNMVDSVPISLTKFWNAVSYEAGEPMWFNEVVHLKDVRPKACCPKKEVYVEMLKRRQLDRQAKQEQTKVPVVERPNQRVNHRLRKSTKTQQRRRAKAKSFGSCHDEIFAYVQEESSPMDVHGLLGTDWSYEYGDIEEEIHDPHSYTPEMDFEDSYPSWDDASGILDKDLITVKPEQFSGNMYLTEYPSGEVDVKEEPQMEGVQDSALSAPQVSDTHQNMSFYHSDQCMMDTVSSSNTVQCEPLQYSVVTIKEEEQEHVPDE
ncbi:uncharacterized protein LOC115401855 isoform X1 [Salarias fasciatus]|uniref:uncharacterized protein LOC115401855 isoform X1 n=1 Tax=Salarias fasciatus TaxID=181472 RepID=UPI001176A37A|nr:uncharacterized protein LOC115401855 isoform X1 [Salarias fasciatus]XP_029966071.1 uncharacterized protein LOC115401855 isoform X1 [Salarias fasciatus]XP_029966072.1 uncharacterized protein LOC115401855 isoform X1 [Salarias fasciatus]